MNSQEEKRRKINNQPPEGLESPFLEGEFFASEVDEEWEARLGVLEAVNPFQHAFVDQTLIKPESLEEEFVEEEQADADGFPVEEVESYGEEASVDLEDEEAYDEEEVQYVEGEAEEEKALARMKFEFQTQNRIWRNDGTTSSKLDRKYGPNDFLVDNKGLRLESEFDGVLEFETEWFRTWPKLKEAIEKAVKMTEDMNNAAPSKYNHTRKAFPFNIDHLRRGSAKEKSQGFWDKREGMEGGRERILRQTEELEIEIIDAKWWAAIQSSECFLLEYYESFLRQHEEPSRKNDTINHAKAILNTANTDGLPVTELAKLRSFLQIITNYIMHGTHNDVKGRPAKFAFGLMSRTNFASMYWWLLTQKEKRLFQKIVRTNGILNEMGLNRRTPVFINGYGRERHEPGPTVHEWLSGIVSGVDLLSVRSGKGLSAAMGRYNVETRRGKKDRWLVKFETRNTIMGRMFEPKDWVMYASKLFDLASKRERYALLLFSYHEGIADKNKLTNFVFHARHPELRGRQIREGERELAQEWLWIREDLVGLLFQVQVGQLGNFPISVGVGRIREDLVRPLLQGVQPELEEFEDIENQYERSYHFISDSEDYTGDEEAEDVELEDEVVFTDTEEYENESELFEELVPLTLPAAAPKLPSDAKMRDELKAMKTTEARALEQVFASFGDFGNFVNLLPTALRKVYTLEKGFPQKHIVHVARLGAESFIYDAPRLKDIRLSPWVDYPDINWTHGSRELLESFLHFSMRRLHQICRIATRPETHRRQMDRAGALFRFFNKELAREYHREPRQTNIAETLLLSYRTLLVQIIWLHYQQLLDGWLTTAAKSQLPARIIGTEWENILRMAAITQVDDTRALVPAFNLTPILYRDYFDPKGTSDIRYQHYTSKPPPFTGHGPDMSFTTVFRRRVEQKMLIKDLRTESVLKPIPNMHDNASWQAWVRGKWDKPKLGRPEGKLELMKRILDDVGRYFDAFTIHAPHDLLEGFSQKNYLTRVFPRAVTGSLVHDCLVYACRWLHILGPLLTPGSTRYEGIAKPCIFLIWMPAHVGVMIRGNIFNREVIVSINNKDAVMITPGPGDVLTDEEEAETVVLGMYRGMKTPFVVSRITSKPADAKALWNEVCKLAEKGLALLPYKDPKEPPYLRYLKHNARVARIKREFKDAVRASWAALRQSLEDAKSGGGQAPADLVRDEIRNHETKFETAVKSLNDKFESETIPLIKEINADLDAHKSRIPKGVLIVETESERPFISEVDAYRGALEKARRTGDVATINPEWFFPDSDFAAGEFE